MAIPVARVHLAMAHAALPALLPTPPKCKMLPLLPTPCATAAAILILPKPNAKPGRADSDERWDARKTKLAGSMEFSASSSPRRSADSVSSRSTGRNPTSPRPKPGRTDSVERWDAHKKAASPASSPSSSGTSPLVSSTCTISRASSGDRWDVHKKRRPPPQSKAVHDDGESSSSGSNDIDTEEEEEEEEEEEILWKPRAMYSGPGFVVAAPESSMLPVPTTFLVPVA